MMETTSAVMVVHRIAKYKMVISVKHRLGVQKVSVQNRLSTSLEKIFNFHQDV
jgi:hypothetical protein